jgi:uncharacterized protein YggE
MKKCMTLVLILCLTLFSVALAGTSVTGVGSGEVRLNPDMAVLNLGVSATEKEMADALAKVNSSLASLREALNSKGIGEGDIAVSDIYMYPQYDYDYSSEGRIIGYNVSHQISVTVRDVSALGALIDCAVSSGATQLNGVSFNSSQYQEAYLKALALAVQDARERAEVMAEAAGLAITGLTALTEGGSSSYYDRQVVYAEKGAGDETQVDVGAMSIQASVTAVFDAE